MEPKDIARRQIRTSHCFSQENSGLSFQHPASPGTGRKDNYLNNWNTPVQLHAAVASASIRKQGETQGITLEKPGMRASAVLEAIGYYAVILCRIRAS
jgi:hypothetical protein